MKRAKKRKARLVGADMYHGFQCNGASVTVEHIHTDGTLNRPAARVSILTKECALSLILRPPAARRLAEMLVEGE